MQDKDTLYARFASGEISDEELIELRKNGSLEALESILKATDSMTLPKYDTSAGYTKFRAKHISKKVKVRSLNRKWLMGIAAAAIMLVFATVAIFSNPQQQVVASNGINEHVNLLDGSSVVVNDGSSIKYNADNWEQNREIFLTGEALFKVEKGSPFVVNTKNGVVRVLGTKFNVRTWGTNIYVECYEGKVQVIVDEQETILVKNESVNVVLGEMKGKKEITHQNPQWLSGNSRFYDERFVDVLAELERQYDIKIEYTHINQKFSGNFQHDDLENALLSICKPLDIKYTISQDKKTVLLE